MAILADTHPTLLDVKKRLDPNDKIAKVVEMLVQTNEILDDMTFMEGNLPTGHQTTVRTGLPDVYWRLANRGVPSSKSRTAQVTEACGQMEARSEIDVKVADLGGNAAAFRSSEQVAFLQALNHESASTLFYGNSSEDPEQYNGLSVRYSSLSAGNGENIVSGGSEATGNTSIWLLCWGPQTLTGIYPKGSKAGLSHEDLGIGDAFDENKNRYRAYMDLWKWEQGIALRDWQYAVRIANINIANLVAGTGPDLTTLMTKAIHRIPHMGMGRCAFYANRTIMQYLDIQRQTKVAGGGGLTYENVDGKNVLTFRGIPIRKVDALLNTESQVT